MSRQQFNKIISPPAQRSVFQLDHTVKMSADMGVLYPFCLIDCEPGSRFSLNAEVVARVVNPLIAPIIHEVNIYGHYFFMPYNILSDTFEDFIRGGDTGTYEIPEPEWVPTDYAVGSLWDYCGMPAGVLPDGAYPLDYPKRAYNLVWNDYYRDPNLQTPVDITTSEALLRRCWEKDFFTSCLPWQQRGTAPALPISLSGSAALTWPAFSNTYTQTNVTFDNQVGPPNVTHGPWGVTGSPSKDFLESGVADLSSGTASSINIADLRLAIAIQRMMELSAVAGSRYTEWLRANFGVSPRDETLERPEYIGGFKTPLIVSEVLQTSSTVDEPTPQGNLAGHGIAVARQHAGSYFCKEYGIIIGILSIMPRTAYQQGISRQWLKRTRFDWYNKALVNLPERAVIQAEVYATGVESENQTVFGYRGVYDEMRYMPDRVCGLLRDDFKHYHLGRIFSEAPLLNEDFVECVPRSDIFSIIDEPGFILNVGNIIRAVRPIPVIATPGGRL